MLGKIGNSLIVAFCGIFLGAIAGLYLFASIYFLRHFALYALGLATLAAAAKLFGALRSGGTARSVVFSTFSAVVLIAGLPGSLWLLVGEDVRFDNIDMILLIVCSFVCTLGLVIILPIRMIWTDTRIGRRIDRDLRGAKILLSGRNR